MPKKKLHFILFLTSIFASLVFLSGCVEEVYVDPLDVDKFDGSIRFMQADERFGNTTFQIYDREDPNKVVAEATVGYASVSGYFRVPAGERKVRIVTTGDVKRDITTTVNFSSYFQSTLALTARRNGEPQLATTYERYTYSDEAYKIDDGSGTRGAVRIRNMMTLQLDEAVIVWNNDNDTYWGPYAPYNSSAAAVAYNAILAGGGYYGYRTVEKGNYSFGFYDYLAWMEGPEDIWLGDIDFYVDGNVRYTIAVFGTIEDPIVRIFTDDGK